MRQMWINQPSTLQDWHHRHGENVLVDDNGMCHFINGDMVKIPPIALSHGHRQADTTKRQIRLQGIISEWEIGCRYLVAAGARTPGKPTLSDIPRMFTAEEKTQEERDDAQWKQLVERHRLS